MGRWSHGAPSATKVSWRPVPDLCEPRDVHGTRETGAVDPAFSVRRVATDGAVIELSGPWLSARGLPDPVVIAAELSADQALRSLGFDTSKVLAWDSGLVTFVLKLLGATTAAGAIADRTGLPDGVRRLLALAEAVPEKPALAPPPRERALGIVSLISFLIGLILAFVGAVQLHQFGASIFVANLVAIAMTREIGCLMTAIVMSGRTGAAFAAQLGTMNANQEIDALSTMGISSMEFLVLPRMLALIAMMPLLTIYADLVGILGGAVVGTAMLGLSAREYFEQTRGAVAVGDFLIGVVKSSVFGVVVALAGCLRGMQSGRSAAAVGLAATSAVVTSIVLLIVLDGFFAVLLNVLGL
jgi:ABC transport permease subunit